MSVLARFSVLLTTIFVLFPPCTTRAGDPLGSCWNAQLKAAAVYAKAAGACLKKAASPAQDPSACDASHAVKLGKRWKRAEAKAAKKGASCSVGLSVNDARMTIREVLEGARDSVLSGITPSSGDSAARLAGALAKAAGSFARQLLWAEAKNAKKPDPVSLGRQQTKARNRFRTVWDKAVTRAEKKGLILNAASASLEPFVEGALRTIAEDVAVGVPAPSAPSGGGGGAKIVHRNHGIKFTTKRRGATLVVMRWNASKIVRVNAVEYEFQWWWGDSGNWYSFLHTEDPSDEGTPIGARLPGSNDSYCLRMVAIGRGGEYVGSGTSGNRAPCI